VSDNVLRAWENRYGLLQPVHSPGGLRLYSEADERRLGRMQAYLADELSTAEAARVALSGAASTPARRYVPELAGLSPARIHTPWRLDAWHRTRLGYPNPLTDPQARSRPGT
jgi:hypothetical protein